LEDQLEVDLVLRLRRGGLVRLGHLEEVARGQAPHGWKGALSVTVHSRIPAVRHFADQALRLQACLLDRPWRPVGTYREPSLAAADLVLQRKHRGSARLASTRQEAAHGGIPGDLAWRQI